MRKIKLFALLTGLMLSVGTMFADDPVASGTCGENLLWELTSDGALIITGTGEMSDFDYPNYGPWHTKRGMVKSITLPNGLTTIGDYAFYNMDEMNTAVVVPEGVTNIGYCAFSGARKLPAITLPSTLTTIETSAFAMANKLTSLTIPANVNSIGTMLTQECDSLKSIAVDANNTTFDSRDNCNAIIKTATNTLVAGCRATVIPNTVVSIGTGAFSSIKSLTAIKIPNSVTTLGNYCFQYCTNVEALVLPTSVVNISGTAFTGCVFKTISVNPGHPKFDSRDNCNAIIETATNTLVKGCENSVLPNEIVALGEGAFMSNKKLKFINIPASVERLEKNALIYCNGLEAITCYATTPPVADNMAFKYGTGTTNIPSNIPIYVPAASIDAYRNAANWNYFTNFVPLSGDETVYYTVKALANHGEVNGTGTYVAGTEITLVPVAEEGYVFKQWSDGTTANPKSLTVTQDMTIRAMFEKVGESAAEPEVDKSVPNAITFKFQAILNAFLYNVVIMKDGERVVSVLLDEDGNIKLVTKPVSAPSRMKVRKAVNDDGSLFTIVMTELQVGEQYTYMVDAYDDEENCISAKVGSFDVSVGIIMGDQSTAAQISNIITANNGQEVADVSITRTIQRNGYFGTLCVPFSMNASQIANSSLSAAEIREFTKAEVVDNQLYVICSLVTEIAAGKPYFIRYAEAEALNRLDFSDVIFNADAPAEVTHNNVTMKGTYIPYEATSGNCLLFLDDNNTPYWPSTPATLKPFRSYLVVNTGGALVCGMPVNIVEREKAPTALENIHNGVPFSKTIENGMLIIEKNGVRYNAQGQIVK